MLNTIIQLAANLAYFALFIVGMYVAFGSMLWLIT
jgi:hypothetical protein